MVNSVKIFAAIVAIYGAGFLTGSILDWSPLPKASKEKSLEQSSERHEGKPFWVDSREVDDKEAAGNERKDRGRRGPGRGWSPDPEKIADDFVRNLDRQLDLNPAQETHLLQVFQESHKRMKELREEIDPKMKAEFSKVHELILETLDEAQKKNYLSQLETNRWNRGRRPPPPNDTKHPDRDRKPEDGPDAQSQKEPTPVTPQ
jgi:hypothetical protein